MLQYQNMKPEDLVTRVLEQEKATNITEILRDLNDTNAILEFRHTFLSNFYTVPVTYQGVEYPSVEHAYQAQKFTPEILGTVNDNPEHLEQINETLHLRGQPRTFKDARNMFTDKAMSSGNVKVIADILRDHGYVRDDWDKVNCEAREGALGHNDKVLLMATLLQEKFKDPKMQQELLATADKYLVEGNTWDDTLWGVSGGRGRNLLGLMLMDVRGQLQEGTL